MRFWYLRASTIMSLMIANSTDPDEMPHKVASHQSLHYLLMSSLWGTSHERI